MVRRFRFSFGGLSLFDFRLGTQHMEILPSPFLQLNRFAQWIVESAQYLFRLRQQLIQCFPIVRNSYSIVFIMMRSLISIHCISVCRRSSPHLNISTIFVANYSSGLVRPMPFIFARIASHTFIYCTSACRWCRAREREIETEGREW